MPRLNVIQKIGATDNYLPVKSSGQYQKGAPPAGLYFLLIDRQLQSALNIAQWSYCDQFHICQFRPLACLRLEVLPYEGRLTSIEMCLFLPAFQNKTGSEFQTGSVHPGWIDRMLVKKVPA